MQVMFYRADVRSGLSVGGGLDLAGCACLFLSRLTLAAGRIKLCTKWLGDSKIRHIVLVERDLLRHRVPRSSTISVRVGRGVEGILNYLVSFHILISRGKRRDKGDDYPDFLAVRRFEETVVPSSVVTVGLR